MLGRRRLVGLGLAALAVGGKVVWDGADTLLAQDQDGATGALLGQVVDAGGGPLPGVTVTLLSASLEAGDLTLTTDGDGRFGLSPAPVGLYDVQADRDGFRTGTLGAVTVATGKTTQATVMLERRVPGDGGY